MFKINYASYTPIEYRFPETQELSDISQEAFVSELNLEEPTSFPKESDFIRLDIPDQEESIPDYTETNLEFSNKKDYINKMRPILRQALIDNGIDESYTDLLIAQTALESGWGRSSLSKLYNNFGGIKGSGKSLETTEYINGKKVKQKDSFKAYSTVNEFADDYVKKLKDRFKAFDSGPNNFLANLKKNNYFTAPLSQYKASFNKIVQQVNSPNSGIAQTLEDAGIKVRVTSEYRPGARTSNGSASWHSKKDTYGNSRAVDIVPEDGNFDKLRQQLISNSEVRQYFAENGLGIIDETSADMMRRTGATGKHFHIGPDTLAVQTWNKWING